MTYLEEIWRKLVHLASATIPIVYWFTTKQFVLGALIPLAGLAIVIEALRHGRPAVREFIDSWLGRIIRRAETHTLTGATYVVFAALLAIVLFDKPIAITVLLFLSISDALASLIGIRFGRRRFLGKTLAGSTAFLVSAVAIALLLMHESPLIAVSGAVVATIVEALPLKIAGYKIDDNLSIPIAAGSVMSLLQGVVG